VSTAVILSGPVSLADADGNDISSQLDVGVRRIEMAGKVTVIGAQPPPSTTPFAIFADTPLVVGNADTVYVIPDGTVAHIQQLSAGNEDPTKGAVIEVIYNDAGTERLVARIYTAGQTELFSFADISASRDGTSMTGNAGGTKTIILRRTKFAGSDIAIDAVIRGYLV
jgi:hypothetical protein